MPPELALLPTVLALVGRGLDGTNLDEPCRVAAEALGADAVAVTVASQLARRTVVGASDEASRVLEQAQLTVGEGPCTEATRTRRPVVTPDLTDAGETRWPLLVRQLQGSPVRAVTAVPLVVGRTAVGSLDVHAHTPHGLDGLDLAALDTVARTMTLVLLALRASDPADGSTGLAVPAEVHQATGMVIGALAVSPADALDRLRALAFLEGRLVADVARDVLAGRIPADLGEPRPATRTS